jgi:predicted alpha/beta-fold hydrolase
MTFYAWARRRSFPALPPAEARYFTLSPVTKVLAHCHWHDDRRQHPTVLLLHGLEGSSDSHYMKGLAEKAFVAGFNAVRLNQRNCGGTDHLSEGLYHSGLADDPRTVLRELIEVDRLPALAVVGYSLGGNVALRLAGEDGADAPPQLKAVCAVSAPIELGLCMDLMERAENRLYEWHFMLGLRERMRVKARLYPHLYDVRGLDRIWSVRGFDDRYTAPHHGFAGADDYYQRASAMRVIDRIRVPTLLITSEDDPFISAEPYRRPEVTSNPALTVIITPHGGHCGFVERPTPGHDGYWAEETVVEFLRLRTQDSGLTP